MLMPILCQTQFIKYLVCKDFENKNNPLEPTPTPNPNPNPNPNPKPKPIQFKETTYLN